MPAYSSLRTFINSLTSGETNITRTFGRALAAEGVDPIRNRASVDPNLSDEITDILERHGMSLDEIAHVANEWPPAMRNQARRWILAAVAANRSVAFSWELFGGDDPANRRGQSAPPDPIRITFLSPRKGVRLSRSHSGTVHVDR